jgi:hypothetical protein
MLNLGFRMNNVGRGSADERTMPVGNILVGKMWGNELQKGRLYEIKCCARIVVYFRARGSVCSVSVVVSDEGTILHLYKEIVNSERTPRTV